MDCKIWECFIWGIWVESLIIVKALVLRARVIVSLIWKSLILESLILKSLTIRLIIKTLVKARLVIKSLPTTKSLTLNLYLGTWADICVIINIRIIYISICVHISNNPSCLLLLWLPIIVSIVRIHSFFSLVWKYLLKSSKFYKIIHISNIKIFVKII